MTNFSAEEKRELLRRVSLDFSRSSAMPHTEEIDRIRWDDVVLPNRTVQQCKLVFYESIINVRSFRNLSEILSDVLSRGAYPVFDSVSPAAESAKTPENHRPRAPLNGSSNEDIEISLTTNKPSLKLSSVAKNHKKSFPGEPLKPQSPVQLFLAKQLAVLGEQNLDAVDKKALIEKFKELKPSRRVKFITQAVEDDLRYQEEARLFKLTNSDFECLPRFSCIYKKDLEWWMSQKQINMKTPTTAFQLFVQEKTKSLMADQAEDTFHSLSDRSKQISSMWNALHPDEKTDFATRAGELMQQNKEALENSSDAVRAVDQFLRQPNSNGHKRPGSAINVKNSESKRDRQHSPAL